MRLKTAWSALGTFVLCTCLIIWFSAFGYWPTTAKTWTQVVDLLKTTFSGGNVSVLYTGASWLHIVLSVRLIAVALVMTYLIAALVTIIPVRIRFRPVVAVVETCSVFLESVPDTLYVIFTVVLVVYLVEHTGIDIPAFAVLDPTWQDTFIPALALSLPGAFYLRRVWTIQLQDEMNSRYVETAVAKGASKRRVFYRHVLPNLGPSAISHFPFVATMILSTSLFAEFFMEYQGQLFQFTSSVGLDMERGDLENPYHTGAVVVVGLVLMLLWWLAKLFAQGLHARLYPGDLVRVASPETNQVSFGWIAVGTILVVVVLFAGTFPELFTPFRPMHQDLGTPNEAGPPYLPLPPSHLHPLGTDTLGRDVLSDTLYGIFQSLYPAVLITILAVIVGMTVASMASVSGQKWFAGFLRVASDCLSSVPALFILFLALYHRTSIFWLQMVQYILWFVLIESLRTSYVLYESIQSWFRFAFVEGAASVGQTRSAILRTHLRSWFNRYLLEFSFSTFVRVMSLMAQLAALHIYTQITVGYLPFKQQNDTYWPQGIISQHYTWFGMIGDSTLSMNFLFEPLYLVAPVVALALTVIGVNLIARGLRGGTRSV
jgi:ABC-type dipeptide/oligopeptide/nickel transport system permease subunit